MGTVEGEVALRRKIRMSIWDMLSLRCLLDIQFLELKAGVSVGYIHLGITHMNMTFKAFMQLGSPRGMNADREWRGLRLKLKDTQMFKNQGTEEKPKETKKDLPRR